MPMYNLLEYKDNYSKTLQIIFKFYKYEKAFDNNGNVVGFTNDFVLLTVADTFKLRKK